MSGVATRRCAAVVVATWCGACSRGPAVAVRWAGPDTATVSLPARATWCAPGGPLVLIAESNDTGFGMVLYPADRLVPGSYPVTVAGTKLPRGAAAVRWPGKAAMNDYSAIEGTITLERAGAQVSGGLEANATTPGTPGVLRVTARFVRLPVTSGGADCGARGGVD